MFSKYIAIIKSRIEKKPDIITKINEVEVSEQINKNISYEEVYKIIDSSMLFDKIFYLKKYPDIRKRNIDPVRHYIKHGSKENRWPNEYFDNKYYKSIYDDFMCDIPLLDYINNPKSKTNKISIFFDGAAYYHLNVDVKKSKMHPLIHYIKYGKKEGRQLFDEKRKYIGLDSGLLSIPFNLRSKKVAVIIPVYNALEETIKCIDSVLENTRLGSDCSLIIMNDASTDSGVRLYLNKLLDFKGVLVHHNEINLGYTKNVNKGIELASGLDVVLLNSDTIVSSNWLRQLKIAAYQHEKVGTVTAVSNGAGSFSVPYSGWNDIPEGMSSDEISRLVSININNSFVDVPTGNGFCLYIKGSLIAEIGNFDTVKFPRGYGEENDFCTRAVRSGWTNLIDTKTYVYHKRSASFKGEKETLIAQGVDQVVTDNPNYKGAIKSIGASKVFSRVRATLKDKIISGKINSDIKPKIMFVISTRTGGTPQTNLDLMKSIQSIYDCYVLASNSKVVEVLKAGDNSYEVIETHTLTEPVKFSTHRSFEYENLVKSILYKYSVEILHIRHIAWHSLLLPHIAEDLGIPVVKSFHDFYSVCPSVNLVDEDGNLDLSGLKHGRHNPLWNDETVIDMSPSMSNYWKNRMSENLSICDHFVTTCNSAKDIISDNLLFLKSVSNFSVIPHGRDFSEFIAPGLRANRKRLKVLLPGNITLTKGKELLKKIKYFDKKNIIEFHVLGYCPDDILEYVISHGRYKRDEFHQKVRVINPDIAAVLSIWPETYCHTLTESWASGLPVFGLKYGAVEDRIKESEAGWLATNDAFECYEKLISIHKNEKELCEKYDFVLSWQKGCGLKNTIRKMSGEYLNIYRNISTISKPITKKIGMVLKGNFPEVPPTAYIRLVDWIPHFEREYGLKVEIISWDKILTKDLYRFEKIIIQRDAIPIHSVEWCLDTLKKENIKYIYEIDDNLLDVPKVVDSDSVYFAYRPYLINLLKNASEVHVTNNALHDVLFEYNNKIIVRPNRISKERWCSLKNKKNTVDLNLPECDLKVLYFGSKTHQQDLDFIINVINKARISGKDIQLYIIGVGDDIEKGEGFVTRLTPPNSRYDIFVDWLVSIKSNFDIGVSPLVDESFSATKSYLKCIEFQALGLPVLCSDIAPYNELKGSSLESDIVFCKNDVETWSNLLVSNKDLKLPGELKDDFLI